MIEVLNKLINILVGTVNYEYILKYSYIANSYYDFVYGLTDKVYSDFSNGSFIFDFKLFFQWFFSTPEVIISFVFYLLCAWGVFYFCLIVPYRFIKSLLPKAIKGGKQ